MGAEYSFYVKSIATYAPQKLTQKFIPRQCEYLVFSFQIKYVLSCLKKRTNTYILMANENACFFQLFELKKEARKKEMRKEEDEEEITWTREVAGDFELEQLGFEQDR